MQKRTKLVKTVKRFDRHNEATLFIETIFVASWQTGGGKPKTAPCSKVEPPLRYTKNAFLLLDDSRTASYCGSGTTGHVNN